MNRRESRPVATDEALADQDTLAPDPLDEESEEELLRTDDLAPTSRIPIYDGVRAVYLGPVEDHAPTLKGKIQVLAAGGKERRTAIPRLFQNYDFRMFDALGEPGRRMPNDHPVVVVRDRPWAWVKHAEHLYFFAKHKFPCPCQNDPRRKDNRCGGGYVLLYPKGDADVKRAALEYIARRERARSSRQSFVDRASVGA